MSGKIPEGMSYKSNARTGAELDVWLGVMDCLLGMGYMDNAHRQRLADRAVELMRERDAERLMDTVISTPPPMTFAHALEQWPERIADAGPTDADMRGEVSHGA